MKTHRSALLPLAAVAALAATLAGCGDADPAADAPDAPVAVTPTGWLLASEPAEALSVAEAKATAKEGDEVVLRGRIGGRAEPISDASPVFTVMDVGIAYCGQVEADGCPVPWDYCCETPETIKANAATVQVVDAQGNAIDARLQAQGLNPLDEVVLVGVVGPRPTPDVLMVKATGVYRVETPAAGPAVTVQ